MKRGLDGNEEEENQPEKKRPALASVIVEALKLDSLQKLCSSLEPILRRIVSEEVERALAKLGPSRLSGRSSPQKIDGPDGRNFQLHFKSRLSLPLFTGGKVEGEQGAGIHVVLLDANTGLVVTSGPESSVKLDLVVLEGDFNNEDDDYWTQEDFEVHVVKEREGKRPLLTGDLQVTLKEGVGTLGEFTFTDNSSWIRSRKFRLGLKVSLSYCEGTRIREAKTDAFVVKDHRGELYKKHYPPALNDEVWRLEKIGKEGSFHKRLNQAGIYTVEDFLRLVVRDSKRLRIVLGTGMSNKMWDVLIEHAKTCTLSGKFYVYYTDNTKNVGVVFNHIYEFSGLIAGGQYHSADSLSDGQKVYVDTLVKKAYENWMHIVEYDGKGHINFNESMVPDASRLEAPLGLPDYTSSFDQNATHVSVLPELPSADSSFIFGEYNGSSTTRNVTPNKHGNSDAHAHLSRAYVPPDHMISISHQPHVTKDSDTIGLALGPPQSSRSEFPSAGPSLPYDISRQHDSGDDFLEEDIRMRSHEMLENEDMQQLLRLFSMGAPASVNASDDGYPYSSYIASPLTNHGYNEDRTRSSGKAVVGWLKLKAALRWGIFVRNKAAQRRAQLVELDD